MSSDFDRPQALIALFDAFHAATSEPLSRIGLRLASDKSFYPRLRDGRNLPTVRKTNEVIRRFSDEWPKDATWPASVPRNPGTS
jgi:hypothetical protein